MHLAPAGERLVTWPRVGRLRALELGTPGGLREELNGLVLAGEKQATAGLLAEYDDEDEELEHVGERLALVDDDGRHVATVEVTAVDVVAFGDVPWSFAQAEGEGDADLADWREGHRRYWARLGTPVTDETSVVCLRFRLA
ncbi:ASCH domain-containing protein [Nocardioides sp. SOB77]|uniref:ASCH domain-containing protein n=1 Tax=Nocardioides oceani TaxID=3058369 RepID=A0ABT8FF39_9ACTN|nr:ASCH domain-containing protein [Nocardioides oceani]MDN4173171.1 ASCH domain-containing protein [Nocardioides oceani]